MTIPLYELGETSGVASSSRPDLGKSKVPTWISWWVKTYCVLYAIMWKYDLCDFAITPWIWWIEYRICYELWIISHMIGEFASIWYWNGYVMMHVKCGLQYCANMLSICYCMWDILYLKMICIENVWYELYLIMSMSHMA